MSKRYYFYLLIFRGGERERNLLFHLFMHLLVDAGMRPEQGLNMQCWPMRMMLWLTELRGQNSWVKIINSIKSRHWSRHLFNILWNEIASEHKGFVLHTEVWCSVSGTALTARQVEVTAPFFIGHNFYLKSNQETNYGHLDLSIWQMSSCKWTEWACHLKKMTDNICC